MASRPVWQGHLRLSLVACPVTVHKATTDARDARFHLLNPTTRNRVKQAWKDSETGDELARRDLARCYEVAKDECVMIDDEEIKSLKLESTKVLDIERFVDARGIDRLYWDQPYYLVPEGKAAAEPFAVIREAMAGEGKVALGRLVMASRERIAAVEARKSGMVLTTLRSHEEVRDDSDLLGGIPDVKIDPGMIDIAKRIIAQSEGPFDPSGFRDRYEEALRELVAKKTGTIKPAKARTSDAAEGGNVIDLMDALRRSLKAPQGGPAGRPAARRDQQPPKAPAKARKGAADTAPTSAPAAPRRAGGRRGEGARARAAG